MATKFENSIQINTKVASEKLAEVILIKTGKALSDMVASIRVIAVEETEQIIARSFVTDRSTRRRKRYESHLSGSIQCRVSGVTTSSAGDFMVRVTMWSKAPPGKVGMLELGSKKEYRIYPKDKEKGFLYFPSNQSGRNPKVGPPRPLRKTSGHKVAYQAFRSPPGSTAKGKGLLLTKTAGAAHHPYSGKHFMKKGMEKALDQELRRK